METQFVFWFKDNSRYPSLNYFLCVVCLNIMSSTLPAMIIKENRVCIIVNHRQSYFLRWLSECTSFVICRWKMLFWGCSIFCSSLYTRSGSKLWVCDLISIISFHLGKETFWELGHQSFNIQAIKTLKYIYSGTRITL